MTFQARFLDVLSRSADLVWRCLPERTRARGLGEKLNLLRLPRQNVRLWGGPFARELYREFTSPHPRLKLIPFKALGVALLEMPETFDAYTAGPKRQNLRTYRRKAEKARYRAVTGVNLLSRLDEVMAIHRSVEARQGRPIDPHYLDEEAVRAFFAAASPAHARAYGVEDAEGRLVAYLGVNLVGEGWFTDRIMGHGEALSHGVMYLLMAEAVKDMIALRARTGFPRFGMYDTYFGGGDGLRAFKHNFGFEPCLVTWEWLEQAPEGEAEGAAHAG